MTTERTCVLYATDTNFWNHTYVSLYSLLVNNRDTGFDIRVLSEATNEEFFRNAELLRQMHGNVTIEWLPVNTDMFRDAPATARITMATYYRLLLDQLLPESVDRLLYLDGDTIIRGSLRPLLDLDVSNVALAGIADYIPTFKQPQLQPHPTRLGLPDDLYFNAGVLYINLAKWRELGTGKRAISYVLENLGDPVKLEHRDQDALNVACAGHWLPLGPTFNYANWSLDSQRLADPRTAFAPGANVGENGPLIVHFTGAVKPWHGGTGNPYAAEYWHYRQQTPYADEQAHRKARLKAIPDRVRHTIVRTIRRTPGGNSVLRAIDMRQLKA